MCVCVRYYSVSVTCLVRIARFCGPLVRRGIPASYTPRLRPSYPTRRRTPSPSGPRDTPPPGLRVLLSRSSNAPERSRLQHTHTHSVLKTSLHIKPAVK